MLVPCRGYGLITEAHAQLSVIGNCSSVCSGEGETASGQGWSAVAGCGGGGGRADSTQGERIRARIFSHFMCMEKTSGLTKTCGSLWSPLVNLSYFSVFISLCLSHLIFSWGVSKENIVHKIIIIIN